MTTQAGQGDERFQQLRRQLLENNYKESFGVDSLDLVSRLFSDLIATTQSYHQVQDRESRLSSDLGLIQSQLFPLRKENARLARENHDLHLDNIKLNEDMRLEMETFSKRIRLLNDEITELKLLNKACEDQMRSKDFVIDQLRDAYETLVDPALKSRNTPHPTLKISTKLSLPPALSSAGHPGDTLSRKESWDALRRTISNSDQQHGGGRGINVGGGETGGAHSQILHEQLAQANAHIKHLEDENSKLKTSLSAREQELSRAGRLIGDAVSLSPNPTSSAPTLSHSYYDSIANSASVVEAANKRIIDQLNSQVDFLNDQLAQREAQVAVLGGRLGKVEGLESELDMKESMVDSLKEENSHLIERVRALEKKLLTYAAQQRGHHHSDQASAELKRLDEERTVDQHKYSELELQFNKLKQEKDLLHNEIIRLQKEQAALTPTLKTRGGFSPMSASAPRLSSFREDKRDKQLLIDLNEEVETLRRRNKFLLKQVSDLESKAASTPAPTSPVPASTRGTITALNNENAELKRLVNTKDTQLTSMTREHAHIQTLYRECMGELDELRQNIRQKEGELRVAQETHVKLEKEFSRYRESMYAATQAGASHTQAPSQEDSVLVHTLRVQLDDKEMQVAQLQHAVDRLQEQLGAYAQRVTGEAEKTQGYVQGLQALSEGNKGYMDELRGEAGKYKEKYSEIQKLYTQLTSEFESLKQECTKYRQECDGIYAQHTHLQSVYASVHGKYVELDIQHQDLKHKYQVECKKIVYAQEETKKLQADNQILQMSFIQCKERVHNLEHEQVVMANKVAQYERLYEEMKGDGAHREEEVMVYKKQIYSLQDEISRYKELTVVLRQEKDVAESKFSAFEEEVFTLKKQLELLGVYRKDLEEEIKRYMEREDKYKKDISQKNDVIIILESKNSTYENNLSAMKNALQQRTVSITHNNEDLMLMTKENQILNTQLAAAHKDINSLSGSLKELTERHKGLEHEKRVLEIEKSDLLAHINALLAERTRHEEELQTLYAQQHDYVHKLHSMTAEAAELQQELRLVQSDSEAKTHERVSAHTQLQQMNEHVVTLQKKVESIEADNRRLMQDTHGLKQTNAMLNERLTIVMKRASAAQENSKLLTNRLSSVERERDTLRAVVEVERQRAADMSRLAETARIETATKDIHLQRLQSELSSLTNIASVTSSPQGQNT